MASLQVQTEDQLAEIERQKAESGDASKSFLGSLGEGMKNYYSFLGGLVPDGVKDIGKSVLSFGKNLFGMGDEEEEKKTVSSPERTQLEETVRVTEGLSESSTELADRAAIEKKRFTTKSGRVDNTMRGGMNQFRAVRNTLSTLEKMAKGDDFTDQITAESVLEQVDAFDAKPGDGKVQMPTGTYSLRKFRKELFDIIDVMAGEDLIAVTDAKEVLRDFDLGQKIADMETSQAEGEDKAGNIRAILQDNVVSEVEEKQLREQGVKDRFFSGTETEAKDEIARLTEENAKRAEEIAMLKAERESRNEMGNMLMAPTSNVVNNQSKTIVPSPIMNPSPPAGTVGYSRSANVDDF
jgi:hypothetical protein